FVTRPIDIVIFVNTRERHVHQRRLDYWQVVHLAFPDAKPDPKVLYTVTYSRGPHQNPEGKLEPTQFVWVKERMVFSVTPTDQS
ncbi:MAG: multiubiquitin domain-containing protein, partial [bacterium]